MLAHAVGQIKEDADYGRIRRRVVLAHAGSPGSGGESERDITIGGIGRRPPTCSTGSATSPWAACTPSRRSRALRYSGSPLPYRSSRRPIAEGGWLVELDQEGLAAPSRYQPGPTQLSVLAAASPTCSARRLMRTTTASCRVSPSPTRPVPRRPWTRCAPVPAHPDPDLQPGQHGRRRPGLPGQDRGPRRPRHRDRVRPARAERTGHPAGKQLLAEAFDAAGMEGAAVMRPHRCGGPRSARSAARSRSASTTSQARASSCSQRHGADKTTLLDAIGFALFGRVPGERGKTRRLRSDHAAPHMRRRSSSRLTIGGRRMRITRKPEQKRPKRRGSGTTTQPAKVLLEELPAPPGTPSPPGGRGGRRDQRPDGHVRRPVLPGRAAAAGPVRAVPARRRQGPGRLLQSCSAPTVPHRRGLARRAPPRHRPRGRRS